MYIFYQPKRPIGYDWAALSEVVTGNGGSIPSVAGNFCVGIIDDSKVNQVPFDDLDWIEITQDQATRAWKFWGNVSGYIKILQTSNATELAQLNSKEDVVKVKYYLTDEDIASGVSFMKNGLKLVVGVRLRANLENIAQMDEQDREVMNEQSIRDIAAMIVSDIDAAQNFKDLAVINHKYLGIQAPPAIVEEYNLSQPVTVI